MKKIVKNKTVGQAYTNWLRKYYPERVGMGMYFWSYLGMKTVPDHSLTNVWIFPSDIAHKVELLAGPHHKVIMKVMELNGARHDMELDIKGWGIIG